MPKWLLIQLTASRFSANIYIIMFIFITCTPFPYEPSYIGIQERLYSQYSILLFLHCSSILSWESTLWERGREHKLFSLFPNWQDSNRFSSSFWIAVVICIGFRWQNFVSRGLWWWPMWEETRSCPMLDKGHFQPAPKDVLLARAKQASDVVCASVRADIRNRKNKTK